MKTNIKVKSYIRNKELPQTGSYPEIAVFLLASCLVVLLIALIGR